MTRLSLLVLSLFLALVALPSVLSIPDVTFVLNADYTATIRVNGLTWLRTDATFFHAMNMTYSTADSTLKLSSSKEHMGRDSLGLYNATSLTWMPSSSTSAPLSFITTYRVYSHPMDPSTIQSIVFEQLWVTGSTGTSISNSDSVLSGFPTFRPKGAATNLGAIQWSDGFDTNKAFVFAGTNATLPLSRGGVSGPIVLFDKRGRTTCVVSSFSNFMSGSNVASKDGLQVQFGVVGSMQSVPAGYSLETIAVFDDRGVNEGVITWGDALLTRYNKRREAYLDDFTNQYLGYCTDNGAYYYYHVGETHEHTHTQLHHTTCRPRCAIMERR